MSIWADQQIHALNAKVLELEKRIEALEAPRTVSPFQVAEAKVDKRTKEYRDAHPRGNNL